MERNAQHAFDAEEVMAYLDGELEPRRAAALAAHLVSCSECQEVAQGFRALSERMLSFEVGHPSAGMNEKVLAALDAGKSSSVSSAKDVPVHKGWMWPGLFSHPRVWAISGAAIVIALVVIGIPGRHGLPAPASHALREQSSGYKSWLSKDGTSLEHPQDFADVKSPANALPASSGKMPVFSESEPAPPASADEALKAPESVGPMIVQTASLNILATNYDEASVAIEKLAAAHGGYVEKLDAKAQNGNGQELSAALRVPTKQLDGFLADVRKLGHVEEETRSNEEVSDQYVDLQARLKSARATEQRLIELLGTRTAKLQDVLEAERELARVRWRDRGHAGAERDSGAPGELRDGSGGFERRIPAGFGLGADFDRNEDSQRGGRGVRQP